MTKTKFQLFALQNLRYLIKILVIFNWKCAKVLNIDDITIISLCLIITIFE